MSIIGENFEKSMKAFWANVRTFDLGLMIVIIDAQVVASVAYPYIDLLCIHKT